MKHEKQGNPMHQGGQKNAEKPTHSWEQKKAEHKHGEHKANKETHGRSCRSCSKPVGTCSCS